MLGYPCVSVKAVDYIKFFCKGGCHLGQVGSASAAENKYIDLVLKAEYILSRINRCSKKSFDRLRHSPCKYADKLCVGMVFCSRLNSAAEISVTVNSDSHKKSLVIFRIK